MPPSDKSKKQAILEAAALLFRDKGYTATSMRDLAQAVQLQASSLYNHILSKQDLLREICFGNAQRFLDGIQDIELKPISASEKIEALIDLHIAIATQDITSITAFNDEWRHLDEPQLSKFKTLRREYENRFKAIIVAGIEQGEFRKLDPQYSLYTFLSALRWVHDWRQPGRRQSIEQLRATLVSLLLHGLRQV